jgi:hypothetical protein
MNKALASAALLSLAMAGCSAESLEEEGPGELTVGTTEQALCGNPDGKNALDDHLAAIATVVLHCKNALAPTDFVVRNGVLTRNFSKCRDPKQLEHLDDLLAIQLYRPSGADPYFACMWTEWRKRHGKTPCPKWQAPVTINNPTAENVRRYLANPEQGNPETNYDWTINGPAVCNGEPRCEVAHAVACAGWAGSDFIVSTDPFKGRVTTDPKWWKDNTVYTPDYLDPQYGYEHRMAQSGLPPGDMWGALNRQGEWCTKYSADMSYIMTKRVLTKVDCDGMGWYCMTMCQ